MRALAAPEFSPPKLTGNICQRLLGDPRLVAAADRAFGKLMAALPTSLRDQANFMRQRLYVDPTGWRGTTENLAMLPVVQEAIARERRLAIRYWRAGREVVQRSIDPLGLVAKGGAWYLVARTPDGLRTYRVSRIEKATLLEVKSERPADFELAAYWKASLDRFDESLPTLAAVLRIEPKAAKWLQMWRFTSPTEVVQGPDADGWTTLRVRFDREEEACFTVLGLGPRVDVLAPDCLRARVAAEAAAVVERDRRRPLHS